MTNTKKCTSCGVIKPVTDYYKSVAGSRCKECRKQWQREYQKRNNSRIVSVHKAYRESQPSGVYTIKNTITNRVYVGQSTMIKQRWLDHKGRLKRGVHDNKLMQEDWNKYGKESFEWSIYKDYQTSDRKVLLENEEKHIKKLASQGVKLYNKHSTL